MLLSVKGSRANDRSQPLNWLFNMANTDHINLIDTLIGRTVLARSTANKIGQLHDLIIDVARGEMAGISVQIPDGSLRLIEGRDIHGFGPDAVMITADESAVTVQDSSLKTMPLAKHNLVGSNVLTASGKLLGQVAHLYLRLSDTVMLIYEVRSSILDKLLGHSLFFPASQGRAISADFARIVVAEDTETKADHNLAALETRLFSPPKEDPVVVIRSRGY
jgi:uncharacterized protein YrrD